MSGKLLEIADLRTSFHTEDGLVVAVDGVSLHIDKGESLAVVGESGSGKSVTALSVLRLISIPPGEIKAECIRFKGTDLLSLSEEEMQKIRGNEISMIFQEPMTSLNPVLKVGFQVAEVLQLHRKLNRKEAQAEVIELFKQVGIPAPEKRVHEYPHQLSGGMRQRVMIAIALSCNPQLLIADEPTTALDVTIQAQILDLMRDLQHELGTAIMIITHDLGVVAETAERVVVMYAGQVVEDAPVRDLFRTPIHPYTYGLLRAIPSVDKKVEELAVITGVVPSPMFYPKGCRFSPRCAMATEKCRTESPDLEQIAPNRHARCWHPLTTAEDREKLEQVLIGSRGEVGV